MNIKSTVIATAILAATGAFLSPMQAHAGDVTNAVLACYIDTFANDQYRNNHCAAVWTPSTANNPTIADFKVFGLPAGNYSYTWVDQETGQNPGCGSTQSRCVVPIATETSGDGLAHLTVTVRDIATGATKTVSARARYLDGWN